MSSEDFSLNVERDAINVEHFKDEGGEFWLFSYADGSDEVIFDPCEAQHKIEHMKVCF
jgi:hypothetical protein